MINNNFLVCVSGPSMAGKTTLVDNILNDYNFYLPVHITTREKRIDDKEGFYKYIDINSFNKLVYDDKFLFYSGSGDRMYGLLKEDCDLLLSDNKNVLVNISYKDVFKYNSISYNKLLITLTFQNIYREMLLRSLNRRMSSHEFEIRVLAALSDHYKYFSFVKDISDCLIYTDFSNQEETYSKVRSLFNQNYIFRR